MLYLCAKLEMKSIFGVILIVVERFESMISTVWGLICAMFVAIFEFFLGYKFAIIVVFVAILLDMFWGIAAARTQGKYTRSELMRDTITKISAYGSVIIVVALLENLILGSHTIGNEEGASVRWGVDIVAFVISCIELWSMGGNILIVHPKAKFFKLMRMSLVGEIARKLNRSEEEVKEVFENNGDFKTPRSNE